MLADFSHLPTRCHFIAFMPQWDFLDFLAEQAERYVNFKLEMQAEVTDLVEDKGVVTEVRVKVPEGTLEVHADFVIGADGRHSAVRDLAGLKVEDLGPPMDVLWMRLSKGPEDGTAILGRIQAGRLFVMLDWGDYWQCAFVIPKGGFAELRRRGLPAFRQAIVELNPALASRVQELTSWDDVKLLTVRVDRLSAGTSLACFASAMRPTPCRRSAALGSTLLFRMRWRPPIFSQCRLEKDRFRWSCCPRCSGDGDGRRG
jgi:2-polyprenyl-6-methoxyphenol hydroxylase-like FAD-dependent oxidoreductase